MTWHATRYILNEQFGKIATGILGKPNHFLYLVKADVYHTGFGTKLGGFKKKRLLFTH